MSYSQAFSNLSYNLATIEELKKDQEEESQEVDQSIKLDTKFVEEINSSNQNLSKLNNKSNNLDNLIITAWNIRGSKK